MLIIAAFFLTRFYNALAQWEYLADSLPFSPAYLAFTGLFWGMACLLVAWSLWIGWRKAQLVYWFVFFAFVVFFWLDRFLMPGHPDRGANNLFWVGFFVLVAIASYRQPGRKRANAFLVKDFFGRECGVKHE